MENQKLSKKNIIIIVIAAVAALLMVAGIYIMLRLNNDTPTNNGDGTTNVLQSESVTEKETQVETEPVTEFNFVSAKDFPALKEIYPHCYAWLEITDSYVSYPIIQHPTNDEHYIRKNAFGQVDECGCIFTEHKYNGTDFNDPVTLIYGHHVNWNGEYRFFGGLQSMYDENLTEYGEIVVHLPEKELHYEVFAALPYDIWHILHGEDFNTEEDLNEFLNKLRTSTAKDANVNLDYEVNVGDKLIVLSTCYNGLPDNRFIVVAKLVETIG